MIKVKFYLIFRIVQIKMIKYKICAIYFKINLIISKMMNYLILTLSLVLKKDRKSFEIKWIKFKIMIIYKIY